MMKIGDKVKHKEQDIEGVIVEDYGHTVVILDETLETDSKIEMCHSCGKDTKHFCNQDSNERYRYCKSSYHQKHQSISISMIPVEGHDHLYRDEKTGAIINQDDSSYQTYLQMKKKKKKDRAEIDEMKNDISEMKKMIELLVRKTIVEKL